MFMLSMDWIKIESADRRWIRWTLTTQLEDLDFADDICLKSHRLSDMQSKTEELSTTAQKIGLKASMTKTKHWKSKKSGQKTKIRLFKSNVLSILLYGSEYWKMTKTINHRLEVFQNRRLRKIFNIFWPNTISNAELHRRTSTQPHHIGDKMTQMAVDWPHLENAADSDSPNCSQMDTRWKTGEKKTERNMEKNGGARNERT